MGSSSMVSGGLEGCATHTSCVRAVRDGLEPTDCLNISEYTSAIHIYFFAEIILDVTDDRARRIVSVSDASKSYVGYTSPG